MGDYIVVYENLTKKSNQESPWKMTPDWDDALQDGD